MTRFDAYQAVVADGHVRLRWRHDLLDPAGGVLATTSPDEFGSDAVRWGAEVEPLSVEPDRVSERTATLRFPVDRESSSLLSVNGLSPLHPEAGSTVELWGGFVDTDGSTRWYRHGSMLIRDPEAALFGASGEHQVNLVDATGPLRGELLTHVQVDDGEEVSDVVRRILADVLGPGDYRIPDTGFQTIAGDAEEGDDRFDLINDLLEGCGWELVADRDGLVVARQILPSGDSSTGGRWVYGDNGIPVNDATPFWVADPVRGCRAEGGGDPPEIQTVYDLDSTSRGFFRGLGTQATLLRNSWTFADDPAQLRAAAYAQLRRHGTGPGEILIQTIPNPAIRQGDMVELDLAAHRVSGSYRVIGYTLPMQVDGLMSIRLRAIWDPAVGGTRPQVDPGTDGQDSFSDDFDRTDQNLEVREGQTGGTPQWVEFGYSWWVRGGRAVQWYQNGWSLAAPQEPLRAFDHYAETRIASIPGGRAVGPVIRSTGTARDGYAAVARNGGITLEAWIGDRHVETLGYAAVAGRFDYRTVRVEADGSDLTVKLDGRTIITASDARLIGRHVGMLGYGGSGNRAPEVHDFNSGSI